MEFLLALISASPPPVRCQSWKSQPKFPVWDLDSWFCWEQNRHYSQRRRSKQFCLCQLTLCGGPVWESNMAPTLEKLTHFSVSLKSESNKVYWRSYHINPPRWRITLYCLQVSKLQLSGYFNITYPVGPSKTLGI